MTSPISRRDLTKGMTWSAPVVVASTAVPAYAASTDPVYHWYDSQNDELVKNGGKVTDLYIFTTEPAGGMPAGFSVGYNPGEAVDTTATLQRLEYYIMVPTQFDNDAAPATYGTTSTNWSPLTRVNDATLTLGDGSSVSTTGYHLYKMTFIGPTTTNNVVVKAATTTWPGTTVDTGFFGFTSSTSATYYAGYIASYTTENGFSEVDSNGIARYTVAL